VTETRMQFWHRRGRQLHQMRKSALCALYRQLGGLGGIHPPEKWTKDEVVTAVAEIEWSRLPDDQKEPAEQLMSPPCDVCGKGEGVTAHTVDGSHNYQHTHKPDTPWVPYYDPCAAPDCGQTIERHEAFNLGHSYQRPAEEQPAQQPAGATVDQLHTVEGIAYPLAPVTPRPVDGPGCTPHTLRGDTHG